MATKSTDGGNTESEYRVPQQARWRVQQNDGTHIRLSPEPDGGNLARLKTGEGGGKAVYVHGKQVGTVDTWNGYVQFKAEFERPGAASYHDAATIIEKEGLDDDVFAEGATLYKTAEDDEGIYLFTYEPEGFTHEYVNPEAVPDEPESDVDEAVCEECGKTFGSANALNGHMQAHSGDDDESEADWSESDHVDSVGYPTPIRLPPNATYDDVEWGKTYDAEVQNVESFGVFVALPDTNTPGHLRGLLPFKSGVGAKTSKLKKLKSARERGDGQGDTLVVAPERRRITDGKWNFTVIDALDTQNRVDFDNPIPGERKYIDPDQDNRVVQTDLAEKVLGVEDREEPPEPQKIQTGMQASPYELQARKARADGDTEADTEADSEMQTQATPDDEPEPDAQPDDADEPEQPLDEVVVKKQYASSEALNEHRDELLTCIKEVQGDLDIAEFIRLKLSELDAAEREEFFSVARDSDLPDDLLFRITRELA